MKNLFHKGQAKEELKHDVPGTTLGTTTGTTTGPTTGTTTGPTTGTTTTGPGSTHAGSGPKEQVYFIPNPNCVQCRGTGYKKKKTGLFGKKVCDLCSKENIILGTAPMNLTTHTPTTSGPIEGTTTTTGAGVGSTLPTSHRVGESTTTEVPKKSIGQRIREKLNFHPNPSCRNCEGTGYTRGTDDICTTCQNANFQQTSTGTAGTNVPYSSTMGFTPRTNCVNCRGTGYRTGSNDICQDCSGGQYPQTYPEQTHPGGTMGHLKEKLGFVPRTDCVNCRGTGYRTGSNDLCVNCKPTNISQTTDPVSQAGRGIGGMSMQDRPGFIPNPNCHNCGGTGYKLGENNVICPICSTRVQQPYVGQQTDLRSNIQKQGTGLENIMAPQSYPRTGTYSSDLGFTPRQNCDRCHGIGRRKGRKGIEKPCKWCRLEHEKNLKLGKALGDVNQPSYQELGFIPVKECVKCHGVGRRRGKTGVLKTCKMCRIHNQKTYGSQPYTTSTVGGTQPYTSSTVGGTQPYGSQQPGLIQQDIKNPLYQELGFIPLSNCPRCHGVGRRTGKLGKLKPCKLCRLHHQKTYGSQPYTTGTVGGTQPYTTGTVGGTQPYGTQQPGFSQQNLNDPLYQDLGFIPLSNCPRCHGVGRRTGKLGKLKPCKLCRLHHHKTYSTQPYTTGTVGGTQPSTTGTVGGTQPYTTGTVGGTQPYTTGTVGGTQPYTTGTVGGTQPYSTGTFGGTQPYTTGTVGGTQPYGSQQPGLSQQNLNTPLYQELGFIPVSNCVKCHGAGRRLGKSGKSKPCKFCRLHHQKTYGTQPSTTGTVSGTQPFGTQQHDLSQKNLNTPLYQELGFIPLSDCPKCRGLGRRTGKLGKLKPCKMCRLHHQKTYGTQPLITGGTQPYTTGTVGGTQPYTTGTVGGTQPYGTGTLGGSQPYTSSTVGGTQPYGTQQPGLSQQDIKNPLYQELGFIPVSNCVKCHGFGRRLGKLGKLKPCKLCRKNYEKLYGTQPMQTGKTSAYPQPMTGLGQQKHYEQFTSVCLNCRGSGVTKCSHLIENLS